MIEFTEKDYKKLKAFLQLSQNELSQIALLLLNRYYEAEEIEIIEGNIVAHGDIPVGLVAHMDTVFPTPPKDIYFDREQNVIWSAQGLGADDRAGIFSIFYILAAGFKPTVIFTRDEEKCCEGAYALITKMPEIKNVNYLIEFDRAHDKDCVFYDVNNIHFIQYVKSFGFEFAVGSYSDIRVLSAYWRICSVNLSVGYENEHSIAEYLKANSLMRTIEAAIQMLSEETIPTFDYIETNVEHYYGKVQCHFCQQFFPMYQTDQISLETGVKYICDHCLQKYDESLNLCEQCMNLFIDLEQKNICPQCEKKQEVSIAYGIDQFDF